MIHTKGHTHGLYPAQWAALRYLNDASPRFRTISDLARFQTIKLTAVGRTVKTLVEKGLLERHPNPRSRKADLFFLTAAGRLMLRRDPRHILAGILDELPDDAQQVVLDSLQHTLNGLITYYGGILDEEDTDSSDSSDSPDIADIAEDGEQPGGDAAVAVAAAAEPPLAEHAA